MFRRIAFAFIALLSLSLLMPVQSSAFDPFGKVKCGSVSGSAVCSNDRKTSNNPITGDNGIILKIVDILSLVTGIIAVIIIIVSGFRFVTSGGSGDEVAGARRAIIYAIVGLIVIALARTIIAYIIARI